MINQENITLYPLPEIVFADPSLALYFKPLLTATVMIKDKPYAIHLLSTDGLSCKEDADFKYAENYFFGFRYKHGCYEFLGDLQVFKGVAAVPALYNFLQRDFSDNRDHYLKNKTPVKEYLQNMHDDLNAISAFDDFEDTEYYAKAFYSYEFTKYYYQKYGAYRHISVVTEGWAKNTEPFLLDDEDVQDILEEFLMNFEEDSPHNYDITADMFAAGTERSRFASLSGGSALALVDMDTDMVYVIECGS